MSHGGAVTTVTKTRIVVPSYLSEDIECQLKLPCLDTHI